MVGVSGRYADFRNETMSKIIRDKFYTLGEIVREKLIPGVTTIPIASRLVKTDYMRNKILDGVMTSRGVNGVMYQVKGENIIKYLAYKDEQKK